MKKLKKSKPLFLMKKAPKKAKAQLTKLPVAVDPPMPTPPPELPKTHEAILARIAKIDVKIAHLNALMAAGSIDHRGTSHLAELNQERHALGQKLARTE